MNPRDKSSETLMNSQCSNASTDQQSSVYRAVSNSLKGDVCQTHHRKYQYFYQRQLLCVDCFKASVVERQAAISSAEMKKYDYFYHLETILNYPIVLVIDEEELISQPIELMELVLSSYKQLYRKKSQLKVQKELINSFVGRVKVRIGQLCDQVVTNYNKMEASLTKHTELKDDLKNIGMMYEEQIMEMLSEKFTEGSKSELQAILEEYSSNNESPMPKILANLDEFMSAVESTPFIDTSLLEHVYTTATDEQLWRTSQVTLTLPELNQRRHQTADILINNEEICLQDQYTLNIQQGESTLSMDNRVLGTLQAQLDSLYQLPNYKLLGVNYDKLMIINYFDQLSIESEFDISGCTDILPFPSYLIAISNSNLIKISLDSKQYEILGKHYKNLKYSLINKLNFTCENERGEVVSWNCLTQFITPVVN